MSRRQPAKQLSAMYSLVLFLVCCFCTSSLSSSASSMLRACSARELLKFWPTAICQSASHPVLDELPAHAVAVSMDRRSVLAPGAGAAVWTAHFLNHHLLPELAEQARSTSRLQRGQDDANVDRDANIPRVLDKLLSTVLVLCTRLLFEPTDFFLNDTDGSPGWLPTHSEPLFFLLDDVPARGSSAARARPQPAARGDALDGVRAALVCAARGEHELDIARALVAAVLLSVLAVYALAHDASSCRLSRRTQPALSALSLALPRLLAAAALDLLNPALRYRRLTRDLTLCVLAVLFGSTRLGFDPNDLDFLPLFCPLRHPAAAAILDVCRHS